MSSERAALITAADKSHVVELAQQLHAQDFTVVSLGQTAKDIKDLGGVPVVQTEKFLAGTGLSKELDGLPNRTRREIVAASLAQTLALDHKTLEEMGWPQLDMAYINLMAPELRIGSDSTYQGIKTDKLGVAMISAAIEGNRAILVDPLQLQDYVDDLRAGVTPAVADTQNAVFGLEAAEYLERYAQQVASFGRVAVSAYEEPRS